MLKRKIKIGCIGLNDPKDRRAVSGISFMTCRAFENMGAEIVWIPLKKTFVYKIKKFISKIVSAITCHKNFYDHSESASKELTKTLDHKLLDSVDMFLCINNSSIVATTKLSKPVIYRTDTTFNLMVDYYWHRLSKKDIRLGNHTEQLILDRAGIVLYPSEWAKASAIEDYKQNPDKLFVVESGANIDSKNIKPRVRKYEGGTLNLLFLGIDWKRKGGRYAIEACEYLHNQGIDVKLNIVGIKHLDNKIKSLPFVEFYGYLNKNNPEQYKKLTEIIDSSHALLLPTIAECAGIVFCESSAYGLPSFTFDTGGVGNYVVNGVNGYKLEMGSSGEDFGRKIMDCIGSGELEKLSQGGLNLYKQKLNWEVWQEKVEKIINNIL